MDVNAGCLSDFRFSTLSCWHRVRISASGMALDQNGQVIADQISCIKPAMSTKNVRLAVRFQPDMVFNNDEYHAGEICTKIILEKQVEPGQ